MKVFVVITALLVFCARPGSSQLRSLAQNNLSKDEQGDVEGFHRARKLAELDLSKDPLRIVHMSDPAEGPYQCLMVRQKDKKMIRAPCQPNNVDFQFRYDPITNQITNGGLCMTPSSKSEGPVEFLACNPFDEPGKQFVYIDYTNPTRSKVSFPVYQGTRKQSGKYDAPLFCLQLNEEGIVWTKPCSDTNSYQNFMVMHQFRLAASVSSPDSCSTFEASTGRFRMTTCQSGNKFQAVFYDTGRNFMRSYDGAYCMSAENTGALKVAMCSNAYLSPKMQWTVLQGGQIKNDLTGKCVEIDAVTSYLKLATCSDSVAQRFSPRPHVFEKVCDGKGVCARFDEDFALKM